MKFRVLFFVSIIVTNSCSIFSDNNQNDILMLKSNPINLSCDFSVYPQKDDLELTSNFLNTSCKLVTYYDSTSCNGCTISSLLKWKDIIDYATRLNGKIEIVFIFSSSFNDDIRMNLDYLKIDYPVLLDSLGEFERLNPHLPKNKAMHTFLLDENNNVVLVGNPLYNKEIEKMFYEEVEKRLGKPQSKKESSKN